MATSVGRIRRVLVLPAEISDQMIAHAKDGLPYEACGLFAAQRLPFGEAKPELTEATDNAADSEVAHFYPMTNAAASQMIYQLDGKENLDVEIMAEEAGLEIVGVMHSHTHTPAYPSPTDVADASRFDPFGTMHFVIVTLMNEEPELRSFKIRDSEITEEEVRVKS